MDIKKKIALLEYVRSLVNSADFKESIKYGLHDSYRWNMILSECEANKEIEVDYKTGIAEHKRLLVNGALEKGTLSRSCMGKWMEQQGWSDFEIAEADHFIIEMI